MPPEPLSMANENTVPTTAPNSREALKERVRAGRLTWSWPLVMSFVRLPLVLVGQVLLFGYFTLAGHAMPWGAAADMFSFYFPLTADLGCLLLLAWLTRREGLRLRDLVGFDRRRLGRDLLLGLGLFVPLFGLGVVSQMVIALIVYGSAQPPPLPYTPPLWVAWWGVLVFPLTVGFMEEMTYRGYALPRLEALTGRPWLALLIVTLGFGLQHVALPLVNWQYSLFLFLLALPVGLVMGIIYLKQRRLLPLIVAHWGFNFVLNGFLMLLQLPSTG